MSSQIEVIAVGQSDPLGVSLFINQKAPGDDVWMRREIASAIRSAESDGRSYSRHIFPKTGMTLQAARDLKSEVMDFPAGPVTSWHADRMDEYNQVKEEMIDSIPELSGP